MSFLVLNCTSQVSQLHVDPPKLGSMLMRLQKERHLSYFRLKYRSEAKCQKIGTCDGCSMLLLQVRKLYFLLGAFYGFDTPPFHFQKVFYHTLF